MILVQLVRHIDLLQARKQRQCGRNLKYSLFACAKNGQHLRVRSGQSRRANGASCTGSHTGYIGGVHHPHWETGVGVEDHQHSSERRKPLLPVAGKVIQHFQAMELLVPEYRSRPDIHDPLLVLKVVGYQRPHRCLPGRLQFVCCLNAFYHIR